MKNTQSASSFCRSFLTTVLLCSLAIIALNSLVDPLRYFRDSDYAGYSDNPRYQLPGLTKNKHYDTIVLGTSMVDNFNSDELDSEFGVTSAVLGISGATAYEQTLTARLALRTHEVKKVIWGMHPGSFTSKPDEMRANTHFPTYMYDDNLLNDAFYVFNITHTLKSLDDLTRLAGWKEKPTASEWHTLQFWSDDHQYGCPALIETQESRNGMPRPSSDGRNNKDVIQQTLEQNLISLIKENPDVEFYLFTPPFSALAQSWTYTYLPKRFSATMDLRNLLFNSVSHLPNVRLYDFATASEVTHNLSHYKDLTHYSPDVNSWMLKAIQQDLYRVAPENAREQAALLAKYAQEYPLEEAHSNCRSAGSITTAANSQNRLPAKT